MASNPILLPNPLQFVRQYAEQPYTDMVFDTTADRLAYLTNLRRYAGQIVADIELDAVFILNSTKDAWLPVGGDINWGDIKGTLSNQTDLQNALNLKANDSGVVHITGVEVITGAKSFNATTNFNGNVVFASNIFISAPVSVNNSYGTTGQVLTSQGTGVSPQWANTSVIWGNITGTLSNQTDLQTALTALQTNINLKANQTDLITLQNLVATKADDSLVVHKAGNETITGVKTFNANAVFSQQVNITGTIAFNSLFGTTGQVLVSQGSAASPVWTTINYTASWGSITGTLANQTDLQAALNNLQTSINTKANDASVVHINGTETVIGIKTFSANTTFSSNIILTGGFSSGGSFGTTGQVLTSTGNSTAPIWSTITVPSLIWGNITGTLSNQTDLQSALNLKANDSLVVHKAGSETITGAKSFNATTNFNGDAIFGLGVFISNPVTLNNSIGTSGQVFTSKGIGVSPEWTTPTVSWGNITGTLSSQTDLQTALNTLQTNINLKANDNAVVHISGNETLLTGIKTFSDTVKFSKDIYFAGSVGTDGQVLISKGAGISPQWITLTDTSNVWGTITGTLSNQTDLQSALTTLQNNINLKANDSDVVHKAGVETITGAKSFNATTNLNGDVVFGAKLFIEQPISIDSSFGTDGQILISKGGTLSPVWDTNNPSWGNIIGTLANQTDLAAVLSGFVHISGAETITGKKTFSTSLVLQSGIQTPTGQGLTGQILTSGGIDSALVWKGFSTSNTNTISFFGDGFNTPLSANSKISTNLNNGIITMNDGLYVPNTITNGLVYGGIVTWTTGYTYNISPAGYFINSVFYTTPSTDITLDTPDAVYNRIDVFAVNTSEQVVIIKGTPSSNPEKPPVISGSELELSFAIVETGTTQPSNIDNSYIYREATEWSIETDSASINPNYTLDPFSGVKSIYAATPITNDEITFSYSDVSGINIASDYTVLTFKIKANHFEVNQAISFQWWFKDFSSNNAVSSVVDIYNTKYGLDTTNTTGWQTISISLSDFGIQPYSIVNILKIFAKNDLDNTFEWTLDDIQLQNIPINIYTNAWQLTGNYATDATKNYIGTNDANPLVFAVNKVKSGWLDLNGNTFFGYNSTIQNIASTNTSVQTTIIGANINTANNITNAISIGYGADVVSNQLSFSPNIETVYLPGMNSGVNYVLTDLNGDGHLTLESMPPTLIQNGIISGGIVTWAKSYTYECPETKYYINGILYTAPARTVANGNPIILNAPDATYNRIDVFEVGMDSQIGVIQGMPSSTPEKPNISQNQIELSFALVETGTTQPSNISQGQIYLEDTGSPNEWVTTTNNNTTINLASTNSPIQGTKDIEATNSINSDAVIFASSSPISGANYSVLSFKIKPKTFSGKASFRKLQLFFDSGVIVSINDGDFGLSFTNTTAQLVTIPLTNFGLTNSSVLNRLTIQNVTKGGNTFGFSIDDVKLQGVPVVTQGNTVTLKTNGLNNSSQLVLNLTNSDTVTFTDEGSGVIKAHAIGGGGTGTSGTGIGLAAQTFTITFDGTTGKGAIGALTIPQINFVNDSFISEVYVDIISPLTGTNSYITLGIDIDAPTAGLDQTTGDIATLNANNVTKIITPDLTKATASRLLVSSIGGGAILSGTVKIIVVILPSIITGAGGGVPDLQMVTDVGATTTHKIVTAELNISNIPVATDNANAISLGLATNDVYKLPFLDPGGFYPLGIVGAAGGSGGSGGGVIYNQRFGIEDVLGVQNRSVDMQLYSFYLDNLGETRFAVNSSISSHELNISNTGATNTSALKANTDFISLHSQINSSGAFSEVVVSPTAIKFGYSGSPEKFATVPNTNGYLAMAVNGTLADSTGNITLAVQTSINLTTNGNTGNATWNGTTLNIPNYASNVLLRSPQSFTATGGQTVFTTIKSFTASTIDIYFNGSKLDSTEYTINSSNQFTLTTPSLAGDIISTVIYTTVSGAPSGFAFSVTGDAVDNTDVLNPIVKPSVEIANSYATISSDTYKRLIYVAADENNNGNISLYLHNGTIIKFLQTIA